MRQRRNENIVLKIFVKIKISMSTYLRQLNGTWRTTQNFIYKFKSKKKKLINEQSFQGINKNNRKKGKMKEMIM